MTKILKHITTFFMALLVLVASMGFTLNKHFCGGELKQVAINKQVELCVMCKAAEEKPACHKEQDKDCCENQQDKVEINDLTLAKKIDKQIQSDFNFIALAPILLSNIHVDLSSNSIHLKEYAPPLIAHNIPVEVQSFLL